MKNILFTVLLGLLIIPSLTQAQELKKSDLLITTTLMYSDTLANSNSLDTVSRFYTDSTNTLLKTGNVGLFKEWYRPTIFSDSCLYISPDPTFPANNTTRLVRGSTLWSWTGEKRAVGPLSDWNNTYIKKESGFDGEVNYDIIYEGK